MKKISAGILLALVSIVFLAFPVFAQEEGEATSTMQVMDQVEQLIYKETRSGGLINRLSNAEVALFGRELPGSIADRQNALLNFIRNGEPSQPSMLFKLGVAEWALEQEIDPYLPVSARISNLERDLEGVTMEDKPLAMRLERLLGLLLSENVSMVEVEIPADTVLKANFRETLSPAEAREGDKVRMSLAGDLVMGQNLIAPRGSMIEAYIGEVKKPRSFGRSSEIKIAFDSLEPLGPDKLPLEMGDAAKDASKADKSQVAAVGTSFIGAILLGPVGLAGGLLIRGDAKEIPEGTSVYVQTSDISRTYAYPVPPGLQGMIRETPISEDLMPEAEEDQEPVIEKEKYK